MPPVGEGARVALGFVAIVMGELEVVDPVKGGVEVGPWGCFAVGYVEEAEPLGDDVFDVEALVVEGFSAEAAAAAVTPVQVVGKRLSGFGRPVGGVELGSHEESSSPPLELMAGVRDGVQEGNVGVVGLRGALAGRLTPGACWAFRYEGGDEEVHQAVQHPQCRRRRPNGYVRLGRVDVGVAAALAGTWGSVVAGGGHG